MPSAALVAETARVTGSGSVVSTLACRGAKSTITEPLLATTAPSTGMGVGPSVQNSSPVRGWGMSVSIGNAEVAIGSLRAVADGEWWIEGDGPRAVAGRGEREVAGADELVVADHPSREEEPTHLGNGRTRQEQRGRRWR